MTQHKWTYMEHWRTPSPRGPVYQYASLEHMDRFVRQIAAVGFTGLDMFDFNLGNVTQMFGSLPAFEAFLRERGIEKLTSVFHAARYTRDVGPHVPATHQGYYDRAEALMHQIEGLAVENAIVMPLGAYPQVEPVDDEKIKRTADMWNRIGEMMSRYGVKLSTHHEFWGGIRSLEEIDRFYELTDPRYVWFFCDAGQHAIAGVDPVALYERYADRTSGFHFKDTHNVDIHDEYRAPADAEMNASVKRWFWEMGTPEGLVDFPALIAAVDEHGFDGWIGVEHDKANVDGGSYAEATAIAMWFVEHELQAIPAHRAELPGIEFGYAINQWDSEHDGFTRREYAERAFKTIAASGFASVELKAASGRWEPLGHRLTIEANYGSIAGLREVIEGCGLTRVSSFFLDPATPFQEGDGVPRFANQRGDHDAILSTATDYAALTSELGGDRLVVRPAASAWQVGDATGEVVAAIAACWNAVGAAARPYGVRVSLHVDALSVIQTEAQLAELLDATDPEFVGLTLDTGELALAGFDPIALIHRFGSRIDHVHLKDVFDTDTLGERTTRFAEREFLSAGGSRHIDRWFQELGSPRGQVDPRAVIEALRSEGFLGTVVVESDQSPDPSGSTMANGWVVQRLARAFSNA